MKSRHATTCFFLISLIVLSTPPKTSHAQELPKRTLTAIPVGDEVIEIDGLLNERLWQTGAAATQFIQQEPHVGTDAKAVSVVRMAYDAQYLYIGALLNDPEPDAVQADERQEDGLFDRSDSFAVLIDSYHDHQNAFFFETNPLSAVSDALVSQEGTQVNRDWDGSWRVSARRTPTGWSAEFRIPFETLRFRPGDAQTWGVQFRRRVPHLKEISFWNPLTSEQDFFEISRSGHLEGIEPTQRIRPLIIKPYVKESYQKDTTTGNDRSDTEFDGGMDFRYRFRTNLTLDLTYNTDFAETEVDRFQANLTRFPLFFPEKREFFLEGKGYYDFGLSGRVQPFFSRRIGLINREAIPILGGGKMSGKVGPYGIGTLFMKTESEHGNPGERFGVFRLSRDLGLRSNIGMIATGRKDPDNPHKETLGFDGVFAPNQYLSTNAFWLSSDSSDPTEQGEASFGEITWRDPFWRIQLNHLRIDEDFDPALGFVQQTDLRETYGYVDIRPQPEGGIVREYGFKTEITYQTDDRGGFLYQSNYNRFQADFRSGDFLLISVDPQRERPEEFDIRPGITIPQRTYEYTHTNIYFSSDTRRPLSSIVSLLWGGYYGGRRTSLDIILTTAPREGVKVGAGWEIDWIRLPQGDFSAQILSADIAWSLSNRLLLQGLFQWDKEENSTAANLRLSWEYYERSWFYFIINPAHQRDGNTLSILTKITFQWEPL